MTKALRGVVATHVFSPCGLAAARGARERKVRVLVRFLRGCAKMEVDVGDAMYGVVLNLVAGAFFSIDVVNECDKSTQGRELVEAIIEAISKSNVSDVFPFIRPLDLRR